MCRRVDRKDVPESLRREVIELNHDSHGKNTASEPEKQTEAGEAPMNKKKTQQSSAMEKEEEQATKTAESEEDIEQLKNDLSSAQSEAAETYDRLLRLSAEFENYKKRVQRQMEDHKKYANEELIKDLLSVVDNLERALNAAGEKQGETDANMAEGIEMTLNEILKTLKKHNVEPVEAMGKPFDPTYHEAVMQEESDEYPENTVIGELQKGYLLHDRLIRPAMVVVSKAKTS
ncbi:MAG: nucleotide exchange factor GrpE [Desulfobacterales bacterium]|nr:nucleotide exchange factor GrpE [Desulfobacterales bacterium]